ncbi:hypothetical protein [Wukongibacter sp. M2B1]|uniref:hypothetical protein n=1 Tax=Wukongibacter sp. M2B1 TaxID=3088895 RepID=UPI003D7A01B7
MITAYSVEENKELNSELKKLQNRAKRLILSDYYHHIHLSDLQYSILTMITNAETHKDINPYLWNSRMMPDVLDYISKELKQARKDDRKNRR